MMFGEKEYPRSLKNIFFAVPTLDFLIVKE